MQEAAAAGVKVGEARRVLKLLQGLESAVSTVNEGQHAALKTKLDAALASGVMSPLVQQAQAALEHLRLTQVTPWPQAPQGRAPCACGWMCSLLAGCSRACW